MGAKFGDSKGGGKREQADFKRLKLLQLYFLGREKVGGEGEMGDASRGGWWRRRRQLSHRRVRSTFADDASRRGWGAQGVAVRKAPPLKRAHVLPHRGMKPIKRLMFCPTSSNSRHIN